MKHTYIFAVFLWSFVATSQTVDIADVLTKTIYAHSRFKQAQNQLNIARTKITQTQGAFFPSISLANAYSKSEKPKNTKINAYNDPLLTSQINLSQNLFRGLQTSKDYQNAKVQEEQALLNVEIAKNALAKDFLNTAFLIFELETDIKFFETEKSLNQKKLAELKKDQQNGTGRFSDLLALQVSIDTSDIQIATSKSALASYYEAFQKEYAVDLKSQSVNMREFSTWLTQQMRSSKPVEEWPEAKKAKLDIDAANHLLTAQRGTYLPTLDLGANYNLYTSQDEDNKPKWTVQLSLNIPLNFGLETTSKTYQAALQVTDKEYSRATLITDLTSSLDKSLMELKTKALEITLTQNLVRSSKLNFENQEKDLKNGLSRMLDVLQASHTHQESLRKLEKSKLELSRLQANHIITQNLFFE